DPLVTGVQTCALPIFPGMMELRPEWIGKSANLAGPEKEGGHPQHSEPRQDRAAPRDSQRSHEGRPAVLAQEITGLDFQGSRFVRSEERRVGKECSDRR